MLHSYPSPLSADWFKSLFWKEEMELTLVGLENSGKTTFVNVIASGQFNEDMIPTIGFNMRKVTKGNVAIKLWDIGGQTRFRTMWERYCSGCNAIVCVLCFFFKEGVWGCRCQRLLLEEAIGSPASHTLLGICV
jgi:hypothetical protein